MAQQGRNVFGRAVPAEAESEEAVQEPAVFLSSDRSRERDLDRARRLAADGRWSDAAVACDEILGDDRDAFIDVSGETGSIRSHAAAIVSGFPRAGREAYLLLFRARAEKRLAEALASEDHEAIVAVARRWFGTPAGKDAAMVTAVKALEAGQPLVATMWLDRIATSGEAAAYEPSLSVMRAIALRQVGDGKAAEALLADAAASRRVVRIAGREVTLSAGAHSATSALADVMRPTPGGEAKQRGDWLQSRGSPSRNTLVDASKPLLVPRYRVPLVRHPDEARRLEQRRKAAADAGTPLLPVGSPLAVADHLVVHTPLGILAIEFESGKRVWLESSVAPSEPDDLADDAGAANHDVFEDATSSTLASDGHLVFAVETPPEAMARVESTVGGFGFGRGVARPPSDWNGGNVLRAYDIGHDGALVWQVPETKGSEGVLPRESTVWFLGPPLVAGHDLYVLAEEGGEVRLECRTAENGGLRWQQPLANYDDRETIMSPEARGRRLAGLTPALAEGVLVCPIGAGSVIAFDPATRSLLWAHSYARVTAKDEEQGRLPPRPLSEPSPVIAEGVVVLSPYDATELVCLQLRDGKPIWPRAKRGRQRVVGIVNARVVVMSDLAVEALDLANGNRVWKLSLADVGRPSGRGILTPHALLLPLDTPEIIEIGLADGRIRGRSQARGGGVPGNLVAHRGEIISRGVDALEVFHQEAALESRIETAEASAPTSPWVSYWRGQMAIESGAVRQGLDLVTEAIASPSLKLAPGTLSNTVARALSRDFSAASSWLAKQPPEGIDPAIARMLVDGYLDSGDESRAWNLFRPLLMDRRSDEGGVVRDLRDPWLALATDRWVRGRLKRIVESADDALRKRIDDECRRIVATAIATTEPSVDLPSRQGPPGPRAPHAAPGRQHLHALLDRLGNHSASGSLQERIVALDQQGESRQLAVRRSLIAPPPAPPHGNVNQFDDSGWPLGVVKRETTAAAKKQPEHARFQLVPIPLAGGGGPGTRAARAFLDVGTRRLVICDALGNLAGEPLLIDGAGDEALSHWGNRSSAVDVAVVGRAIFIRTQKDLSAYDLEAGPSGSRGLWRRVDYARSGDGVVDARWAGGVGARVARDGGVPLGMRINEPAELARGDGRGFMALTGHLVVPGPRSIALLDPASGRLLWERRRLPSGLEWTADGDFLCGLTSDGVRSVVLDADDGRVLHQTDVPHRRQRLATHGRKIVAIRSIDELPGRFTAREVRLDLIDPAMRQATSLGEFSGEARATEAGPGRLAVLEPGGRFTIIDLDSAAATFHVDLPDAARNCARLIVMPWCDRYLVVAGSEDGSEDLDSQQLMIPSPSDIYSGRLWAVDRHDGRPLWPAPALLDRHRLHTLQPPDLPVLTFARLASGSNDRDQGWMSLLVLDKRTGHAILDDDRIAMSSHSFLGCEISGDATNHTLTIAEPGDGAARLTLTFTGDPISPQPPYRGSGRNVNSRRVGSLSATSRTLERPNPNGAQAVDPDPRLFFAPQEAR